MYIFKHAYRFPITNYTTFSIPLINRNKIITESNVPSTMETTQPMPMTAATTSRIRNIKNIDQIINFTTLQMILLPIGNTQQQTIHQFISTQEISSCMNIKSLLHNHQLVSHNQTTILAQGVCCLQYKCPYHLLLSTRLGNNCVYNQNMIICMIVLFGIFLPPGNTS